MPRMLISMDLNPPNNPNEVRRRNVSKRQGLPERNMPRIPYRAIINAKTTADVAVMPGKRVTPQEKSAIAKGGKSQKRKGATVHRMGNKSPITEVAPPRKNRAILTPARSRGMRRAVKAKYPRIAMRILK